MTTKTPKQRAEEATESLRKLDAWVAAEHTAIMQSEALTPSAKRERIDALRKEYQERWLLAKQAAGQDLEEWSDIYEARAESATAPKAPQDRDAGILRALELQRLQARIERHRDQPGRLLAEYERALRTSNHTVAHELEDALPALLPDSARAAFEARAKEERHRRLSDADREKLEEAQEWRREAMSTGQGVALQEAHRAAGYTPALPQDKQLITHYQTNGPPVTYETENAGGRWRQRGADLDLS